MTITKEQMEKYEQIWQEQQKFELDKIIPPPDGQVVVGELGTVVMSLKTFKDYQDIAEGEAIRLGRFENGAKHEHRSENSASVTRDK